MVNTYRAILDGNQIKWIDLPPKRLRPTKVQVTLVEETATTQSGRGQAMAEALEKLAKTGTFLAIADPVVWQREIRQERVLPGREQ